MVKLVPPWVLVRPLLHRAEHVSLDLYVLVTKSRMMKGTEKVIDNLIYGDLDVFPCVQYAPRAVSAYAFKKRRPGPLTGRHIEEWSWQRDRHKNSTGW